MPDPLARCPWCDRVAPGEALFCPSCDRGLPSDHPVARELPRLYQRAASLIENGSVPRAVRLLEHERTSDERVFPRTEGGDTVSTLARSFFVLAWVADGDNVIDSLRVEVLRNGAFAVTYSGRRLEDRYLDSEALAADLPTILQ